ncbi:MAG: hypothetical protein AB7D51_14290 [Desulfovibrionaceae bacterium]
MDTAQATAQDAPPGAAQEETRSRKISFGVREYFDTLMALMRSPGRRFAQLPQEAGTRKPLLFLMISALFYCSVSMTYFFENSLAMGVVMMANALLMPALAAVFSFILLGMSSTARVPFQLVFGVWAYASGAVMVVSWIPGLALIMEPVRGLLVWFGLVHACGLGRIRAGAVVVLTAVLLLLFFWTLAPLVAGA